MNSLLKVALLSLSAMIVSTVVLPTPVSAVEIPAGFQIETLAAGLDKPTTMAFTPDGRVFIAEKEGKVKVYKNGAILATPLITLTDINSVSDHGILGIAVDPQFATNGYVYLSYTYEPNPADIWAQKTARIVRIKVIGDVASESSKVVIVGKVSGTAAQPSCDYFPIDADCMPSDSPSHSAGGLRFGPDGKLYATIGDGAGFESVDPRALKSQNIDNLAGKVLRINTDGTAPTDNPFYNGNVNANRSKVFAYGFRNSFRFNFRPTTGALYAGEVGWKLFEEINVVKRGSNYGWPCREGFIKQDEYNCPVTGYTDPLFALDHSPGTAAITGGSFPTQNVYPTEYMQNYFFADVTGNAMYRMVVNPNDTLVSVEKFFDNAMGPVDIITGPDGKIYYLTIYDGKLRRLSYSTANRAPIAKITATPLTGAAPLVVNFSSTGSSDPDGNPLTYVWNFGDGTNSTLANPAHTYAANGNYTASLTVNDGKGGTNTQELVIRVAPSDANNIVPKHVKTVVSPVPTYIGGDAIITTTVSNSGAANPMIVDIEVYNTAGELVAQKVLEDVTIPTNGTKDFVFTWFPDNIGDYRVTVGLFQKNWAGLYEWTNEALKFNVQNRAPVTPPTQTPFKLELGNVVVTPIPGKAGEPVAINVDVRNSGGVGTGLVDIEVYKDGVQVGQKFTDNVLFAQNELQHFTYNFTPATAGTYKVSVGLFNQNWQGAFSWNADVFDIAVTTGTVTPPPASSTYVFENALAAGWENWSWDTTASFTDKIAVTHNSVWAGFFLHSNGFSTIGKNTLHFEITGQAADSAAMQVLVYGENGNVIATKGLSGNKVYDIALTELNAANKLITGIAFQGQTGVKPKPFTLDNISFK
ncbi:MAG: PQQ-dependent sugar dehydrogenase [Patescibacteria group bacterium]